MLPFPARPAIDSVLHTLNAAQPFAHIEYELTSATSYKNYIFQHNKCFIELGVLATKEGKV
jgi:hypothetical protein